MNKKVNNNKMEIICKKRGIINNRKACTKCLEVKNILCFYNRSDKPHLFTSRCKTCIITDNIQSGKKYIERLSKKQSEYHFKNRIKRNEYTRIYIINNRDKINKKLKYRYDNDLNFRLTQNLRNRIRGAIKKNSKSQKTIDLIGCTIYFLKEHLQSLFTTGMSWDNYGDWQVDHILPCASFDLTINKQQSICFNYNNLQPLWALDNLIKKDKIIGKEVCYR